ncbi:MAG: MoaF N-terminal domain-containing protein [Oscillospiraceae bacterium]|jgi:hypothetical protein|nr:MoaF N-terminal domain-containing protein [Oscillospiraceae bacterium]
MDLREFSKFGGGAFQYVPPKCFELKGQRFELLMDDGYDLVLNFTDDTTVEWNYINKEPSTPQKDEYECRKGDDTTYLVSWCLAGKEFMKRENYTFVIDLEQHLVTHLICKVGTNPRWPYLVSSEFVFGAIKQNGVEYKHYPRHGFSSDPVGNIIQWQYAPEMATVHLYYDRDWYRITYPRDNIQSQDAAAVNEQMNQMVNALPGSDEPAYYVKIKEGMYLVSCTEQNMEKLLGASVGFRSDTLCFLDNYNHMYDVGRGFGTMTAPDGTDSNVFVMIGAYGKIIDPEKDEFFKKMLTDKNPYLV